jgi:hypothetical protein
MIQSLNRHKKHEFHSSDHMLCYVTTHKFVVSKTIKDKSGKGKKWKRKETQKLESGEVENVGGEK